MRGYERSRAGLAAAALMILSLLGPMATSAAGAPPAKSERPVYRVADVFSPGQPMPVGSSNLARTDSGLSARLRTVALTPGDAVTMWWVAFNDPPACEAGIPGLSRCGPGDAHSGRGGVSVMHAAGRVVNEHGTARFAAHVRRGDTSRALAGPGVLRPRETEVILVLKTHGPWMPLLGSAQLRTFGGGCNDQSDAPPGAPAHLIGEPGPNDCAEIMVSIHQPAA